MTSHSEMIRSAARQVLLYKKKNRVMPLSVSIKEIKEIFPDIPSDDILNELDALSLAEGCRLAIDINKNNMLLWQET